MSKNSKEYNRFYYLRNRPKLLNRKKLLYKNSANYRLKLYAKAHRDMTIQRFCDSIVKFWRNNGKQKYTV